MRFMIIIKTTPEAENSWVPTEEAMAAMGKYNEELVNAGVLLAGEGLRESATGAKVVIKSDGSSTVTDGPFTEAKELIAGFWLIQVKSKEEAVAWARKVPADPTMDSVLEVRQVVEMEDFGEEFTPELREKEQKLRDQLG